MLVRDKWSISTNIKRIYINQNIFIFITLIMIFVSISGENNIKENETWPDGTPISSWFSDTSRVDISGLKRYIITDYGVKASSDKIQTEQIQSVIDLCSKKEEV